jgi:hypothetical protein
MKGNTIWVAISCLAVGLLIGREWGSRSDGKGDKSSSETAQSATTTGSTEIPADWVKEADFKAADKFAGLTAAQRFTALKVLNEKPCDCGCPHGSVAKCAKDDPACPRAPTVIATAVDLAKKGKSADEIKKAVEKPAGQAQQQPPQQGPAKIELAAWTPIKGPKLAKVTIVEFSDFQ